MLDQHVDVKKVNGYNPRTEEAPKSVTHTEQWAVLQDGNMHIFKLINKTIEDSSCTSDVVMGLQKYTHEKLLDLKQEKTIVCISGNMGGGKRLNQSLKLQTLTLFRKKRDDQLLFSSRRHCKGGEFLGKYDKCQ